MFSKLFEKIQPLKSVPNVVLGVIVNPCFTDYFVATAPIIDGVLSCFQSLKTSLTTPPYFDPYFDPYFAVTSDLSSTPNLDTTLSEKWKFSLIKTNIVYAGVTIYYYVFGDTIAILEQEIQMLMTPTLLKKKRRTAYVSDFICFHLDFASIVQQERQQKEIKSALKQANSKAESDRKHLKTYPMIQYNSEFLDEKWNVIEKCTQQSDNEDGWDVVETYQIRPINIAPFRNST